MRTVAICGTAVPLLNTANQSFATVRLAGCEVICGVLEIPPPHFDGTAPGHSRSVLLRVRAFSCNYRDRAAVLRVSGQMAPDAARSIGSEFVARVEAVGEEVTDLVVGDRVIGDNHYPDRPTTDRIPGVPTNHASREYMVLPASCVIRIPPEMDDETAAAFSLGAQTAYSMIRKLEIREGSTLLVTAGSSNTSLFAIQAARNRGAQVFVTTTSDGFAERLAELGVRDVFRVDPAAPIFAQDAVLSRVISETGGFQYVVDPFSDVYLGRVLPLMAKGGRYVTCGFMDQGLSKLGVPVPTGRVDMASVIPESLARNLHLIANCLGLRDDLVTAMEDYRKGLFQVFVDSVYGSGEAGGFLERTYEAKDRFGKVVYAYE